MVVVWNSKLIISFVCMALVTTVFINGEKCTQQCANSNGYVMNCSLVSPNHLLRTQNAISQLQCFDICIREPGCEFYNFIRQAGNKSCQMFGGLWSFEDQGKLVMETGAVFTWIARDRYLQWLSPDCPGEYCHSSNSSALIGSCKKPLDIAFLMDTSVYNNKSFTMEKQFVLKVLQRFEQSSRYTKAAIIEYNTYATITFSFNNFTTPSRFTNHVVSIPILSGQTRYDRALHLAESRLFSVQGGARPFAHRVVVLITNNKISDSAESVHWTVDLKASYKKSCIQIFAVGIENGITAAIEMADTYEGHLLKVDGFKDLESKASSFSTKICKALD